MMATVAFPDVKHFTVEYLAFLLQPQKVLVSDFSLETTLLSTESIKNFFHFFQADFVTVSKSD
jgi:hypothetical protein